MIQAYSWCTPNGEKLHIMLEETGLPYELTPINIGRGDQKTFEFIQISPNGKIPAIVDPEGPDGKPLSLMESGAILLYLAEKSGKLLPSDSRQVQMMRQWLFFQVGHVGPMFGQAHHFDRYAPTKIDYAVQRYGKESRRLMSVLDRRLSESRYLAGDEYTVADIATFPWVRSGATGVVLSEYPGVERWSRSISERPAVQRGLAWLQDEKRDIDEEARRHLFGDDAIA